MRSGHAPRRWRVKTHTAQVQTQPGDPSSAHAGEPLGQLIRHDADRLQVALLGPHDAFAHYLQHHLVLGDVMPVAEAKRVAIQASSGGSGARCGPQFRKRCTSAHRPGLGQQVHKFAVGVVHQGQIQRQRVRPFQCSHCSSSWVTKGGSLGRTRAGVLTHIRACHWQAPCNSPGGWGGQAALRHLPHGQWRVQLWPCTLLGVVHAGLGVTAQGIAAFLGGLVSWLRSFRRQRRLRASATSACLAAVLSAGLSGGAGPP